MKPAHHPRLPPHHAAYAEQRRRERWHDLAAALAVTALVLLVATLLPA